MEAYDGEKVWAGLSESPDLILLDLMCRRWTASTFCRALREKDPVTPVIILTAREERTDRSWGSNWAPTTT